MMKLHKASDRGISRLDWLESRHSFSFADWNDPNRMGFRSLRVLNEDRVAPGAGFGPHPHRNMEILTVVLEGELEHRDSSGARTVLEAGDVQRMSAGSGVVHSEWNASKDDALHLLQIWLRPSRFEFAASHAESRGLFPVQDGEPAKFRALASQSGGEGVLEIQQDATIYSGRVVSGESVHHRPAPGRGVWVQAVRGDLVVNGVRLAAGDALQIENEESVALAGDPQGDFLLFDLA
jgi:redox-sensitive bicupin YhaK (pirin superfamily)